MVKDLGAEIKKHLNAEKFREWLETFCPNCIVGKAQFTYECPLARYLHEKMGGNIGVRDRTTFDVAGSFAVDLQNWAVRFIQNINSNWGHGEGVTAAEALACLEDALREEEMRARGVCLDAEGFRRWLEGFHPWHTVVGKTRRPYEGPLTHYLRVTTGRTLGVYPDQHQFLDRHGIPAGTMPQWAVRFVKKVDAGRGRGEAITAAKALARLEEVLPKEEALLEKG